MWIPHLRTRDVGGRLPTACLLAATVLVGNALLVGCGDGRDTEVPPADSPAAAPVGTTTAPGTTAAAGTTAPDAITDILVVVVPDRLPLVGRRVSLTGMKVQTVTGDRTFWIGPSRNQQLFVVLDETPTPGTPTEGKVNVNAGQTVTVTGVIKALPSNFSETREKWSLSTANEQTLMREQIYLAADSVKVEER